MKFMPIVFILLFSACTTTSESHGNLTYGMIKSKVKKGVTTQTELMKIFGSPNIVSKNKSGLEVWTYSRQSSQSKGGGSFTTLGIVGGSSAYSSNSAASFDFIVTFDKNDIVVDYSVVSSNF
ncbi:MAG: hypothetical protein OYH77_00450 [Pseudomonadota bacterium]|nr:hypothetical protein [Pseudomonadota bacterium]